MKNKKIALVLSVALLLLSSMPINAMADTLKIDTPVNSITSSLRKASTVSFECQDGTLSFDPAKHVVGKGHITRGKYVAALQAALVKECYLIDIDGKFGPETKSMLKWFQKENGLERDSVCGPATWAKLAKNCKSGSGKIDLWLYKFE